jgi:hypothetical protein
MVWQVMGLKVFLLSYGFWQVMVMAGHGVGRSWLWQVLFMTVHCYGSSWLWQVIVMAGHCYGRSWLRQVMVIAGYGYGRSWFLHKMTIIFVLQSTMFSSQKPVYTSTTTPENDCRFYNQYEAKYTNLKGSGLPPFLIVFSCL